jgi:hypothetical protein
MQTFAQKQNQPQERVSSGSARSSAAISGPINPTQQILHLQRTIGNQAIQRLLRADAKEPDVNPMPDEEPQVQGGPPNTVVCPPVCAGQVGYRGGAIWHAKVTYRCILAPGIPLIGTTEPSWITVFDPNWSGQATPGSPAPPHIAALIAAADVAATTFTRSAIWGGISIGGIARCHQAFRTSLEGHLYTAAPGWSASVASARPGGHLCP